MAKISSCQVYAISRRGIVELESYFGSIFLLFGLMSIKAKEHPPHTHTLSDSPASSQKICTKVYSISENKTLQIKHPRILFEQLFS